MSGHNTPKDRLIDSLQHYTRFLETRRAILTDISRAGTEIRSSLQGSDCSNVDRLLQLREQSCLQMSALGAPVPQQEEALLEAARRAAESTNAELGDMGRSALALYAESQSLAREVLSCQAECESVLRTRIEATGKAIRESKQRRKLDAAYGQACSHRSPVYLDKQQ